MQQPATNNKIQLWLLGTLHNEQWAIHNTHIAQYMYIPLHSSTLHTLTLHHTLKTTKYTCTMYTYYSLLFLYIEAYSSHIIIIIYEKNIKCCFPSLSLLSLVFNFEFWALSFYCIRVVSVYTAYSPSLNYSKNVRMYVILGHLHNFRYLSYKYKYIYTSKNWALMVHGTV